MIMVVLIGFGGFAWFSVLLVVLVLVLVISASVTPQMARFSSASHGMPEFFAM